MANWSTLLQTIQQTLCPLLRRLPSFKTLVVHGSGDTQAQEGLPEAAKEQ